ncbi:YtfJ family protein [Proteus myxofaciens]|uniref:YtfJ family protein n=1 Tax=Proteus myxofaciens ATCC 19692 TaxID=1354337 RepID=A0A198FRK6_9GAMM|nr:YtfJ family protein [Proteus myxofaciens ATCC 19692]
MHKIILATLLLSTSTWALAHNITENTTLAPTPITVDDKGELLYDTAKDKFSYQNWNSSLLNGKVRAIQHIAGRSKAKEMNAPFIDAVKQAKFPQESYQTTTIINTDDAIFGTGPFVRGSVEDSKKEFPWSQFIVDADGVAQKSWGLEKENSAIIILDKQGKVRFVKEGILSGAEITKSINLINDLIKE